MGRSQDAWDKVGREFSSLGESFRRHYHEADKSEEVEESSKQEVAAALKSLGDAAERLARSASTALRDPDVRDEARNATASLVDALSATFSELGEDLRTKVEERRSDKSDKGEGPGSPHTPS